MGELANRRNSPEVVSAANQANRFERSFLSSPTVISLHRELCNYYPLHVRGHNGREWATLADAAYIDRLNLGQGLSS